MLALAKQLSEHNNDESSVVSKSKILVISHDIAHRQYQGWSFRTLDIVEPGLESFETQEPSENLVMELLSQLNKLGAFLCKQPKVIFPSIC